MTDLELRAGTPYQPLYRISRSFRPDPLAGIDAWEWYTLPAHLRLLRHPIFLTRISFRDADAKPVFLYLFPSQED